MSKKRILMVDDEVGITTMAKLNLERTGLYEVQVENCSTHALAAARAFTPDMIILDVTMPEMDGPEVATQIRADAKLKETPIVFLTAIVSQLESGESQLNSGGNVFLSKPVNQKTLLDCIDLYIKK